MRWPRRSRLRRLSAFDKKAAIDVLAQDPVASILARVPIEQEDSSTAHALGLFDDDGALCAVCWNGGNLVPFGFDPEGLDILADHLIHTPQLCYTLTGPADQVLPLWDRVQGVYSRPREIRERQLSMVYQGGEQVAPDPTVRLAQVGEGGLVFPASVAMFIEEVGFDPSQGSSAYASRVYSLIRQGRTFVRIGPGPDGQPRVEFKADVGALAGGVAQIQGVWTAPDLRGQGIATNAMVSVARAVSSTIAPTVSLYVNDFNVAAVRAYEKAGFETVGNYATVLL